MKSIHSFFDCLENLRDLESTGIGRDCLSVRSAGSSYTGKVPDSHGRSLGAPEVLFKCGVKGFFHTLFVFFGFTVNDSFFETVFRMTRLSSQVS